MSKVTKTELVVTNVSNSPTSVDIIYHVNPITVVFVGDLNTVRFMLDGEVIDARSVLTGLAMGTVKVEHERVMFDYDPSSLNRHHGVKSETWRIVPKVEP